MTTQNVWSAGAAVLTTAAISASALLSATPTNELPLTVMTFNIRTSGANDEENAWPKRRELVSDTILSFSPHVIGLQEALSEQIEYLEASLPDYRWLGVDRGLNGGTGLSEHTPIFYRHTELVPIESGNFWLSSTPDSPTGSGWRRNVSRIVTWARFHHLSTNQRFYVFNTHLTLRRGQRQVDSARMIALRAASMPNGTVVIVTGDFNAIAETSDTWLEATGSTLRDAWLIADSRYGPERTSNDFLPPELANEGRIDWILTAGPLQVRSVRTVIDQKNGRFPSDHYPVVAKIEIY